LDFRHSEKVERLIERLRAFMIEHVYPLERAHDEWHADPAHRWTRWPRMDELKALARSEGLWNLFLPVDYGAFGAGLTNLEYAPLAEQMGRVAWASEVFNCSPPDTGNMEVLARYGTPEQQQRWLAPLLAGSIRSAYLMTEPGVASSDATNISATIIADGDDYVIDGRKWWITNILDPTCEVLLVMGKSSPDAPRHQQHSTIIVPRDTPGVSIVRAMPVFGRDHSPGGECEVALDNVRVPKSNMILGEGRGFEIAQGRLGPGRIHHCMRSIGQAQRALELMARRADTRVAFGSKFSDMSSVRQDIARSWCEVEQARLLTLKAADQIDRHGNRVARDLIAAIKIVVPRMAQEVTDRAIQIFGGMGVSDDTPIAHFFTLNRYLRIADGPDAVHMSQLGKLKVAEYAGMTYGV